MKKFALLAFLTLSSLTATVTAAEAITCPEGQFLCALCGDTTCVVACCVLAERH